MKFDILQQKGNSDPIVLATTRRANGAQHVLDFQVDSVVEYFRRKAQDGDRVVQGPDDQGRDAVVLVCADGTDVVITTWIQQRARKTNDVL